MYHIAVIGSGQLGARHLQGLIRLDLDCRFFVVDPSSDALEAARKRVNEIDATGAGARVSYLTSPLQLPDRIDYAVVATAADVRLAALQALLAGRTVGNLLLEKVLFQRVGDYQAAADLLRISGTRAWVNCPRRSFPIYQAVREFFAGQALLHFHVHGGNWGLGCNSIHFLDLLAFVSEEMPRDLSAAGLDKAPIASKRANFFEFTGSLRGRCGAAAFEITSLADSSARLTVTLRSADRTCFIDEAGGKAFFYDANSAQPWGQREFRNPFVSEQSAAIAYRALLEGESVLTAFSDSVSYHLPLIHALGAHASAALGTPSDFCPIT